MSVPRKQARMQGCKEGRRDERTKGKRQARKQEQAGKKAIRSR